MTAHTLICRVVPLMLAAALTVLGSSGAAAAPYIYSAAITGESGSDADSNGYFETYQFDIEIDADAGLLVTVEVAAIIWCLTTGEWFYVEPWTIFGNDYDPVAVRFTDEDFTVLEPSHLFFEVELWNADFSQFYPPSWQGLPGEPIRADGVGCSGGQIFSAEIVDLTGADADSNGYLEIFSFDVSIDADAAEDCSVDVAALITCTTTGESWLTDSWTITGYDLDPQLVPFTEQDFDLPGPAELEFTVALYDAGFGTKYDEVLLGGTVMAEPPGCGVTLAAAAIRNVRSELDSDGDGDMENCEFDIVIDVDAPDGSRVVAALVNCAATQQQWSSPPWTVNGVGDHDKAVMTFSHGEFMLGGATELAFTVQIWDGSHTRVLTEPVDAAGGPVKVEQPLWNGHLTVRGTVGYKDRGGTVRPLRYARVEIREGPRVKKETLTDGEGAYVRSFLVSRPGNIHIRARTQSAPAGYPQATSNIVTVESPGATEPYYVESRVLPFDGSALRIDMVIDNDGSNSGAFHIFDSVIQGYHHAVTWLQSTSPNEVIVHWPDEGSLYDGSAIHLAELDRWDRDVVMHEYGHFVADQSGFLSSEGGDHDWDSDCRTYGEQRTDLEAGRLAFDEAWATFFSVAAQYGQTTDAWYDDTEDVEFSVNLETDTGKHYSPGEYYESMIACAWWDIFDDHNDAADNEDVLHLPVGYIWSVLHEDKPDLMATFWGAWLARHNYKIQVDRILRDHAMSFMPAGCTITITANIPSAGFELTEARSEPIRGTAPAQFTDMPPGSYTVSWDPTDPYIPPPDSTQAVAAGQTVVFSGTFAHGDCDPPEPNAFAHVIATGTDRISITSETATDDSPPVYYRVEGEYYNGESWVSQGGGADIFQWSQSRPNNWIDDGLLENALYRYAQYVRDSAAEPNIGGPTFATVATLLGPPSDADLVIRNVTATTAVVSVYAPPEPSGEGSTAAWFDIITGEGAGAGAVDRPWAASYTVQYENLLPDTEYGWRVRYRGHDGSVTAFNPNEQKIRTLAEVPRPPAVSAACGSSLRLAFDTGFNPAHTLYAIKCTGTDPADANYDQQWMDQCHNPSPLPVWLTAEQWAGAAAAGLQPLTTYTFAASAKNAAGEETALGPSASGCTTIRGDVNGDCRVNILDLIGIRMYLNKQTCSEPEAVSADLNADGKVNILDMVFCRMYLNKVCPR